jgi:hypothetical protein
MSEVEMALGIDQELPDDTSAAPEPTKGGANGQKGGDPPPEAGDLKELRKELAQMQARLAEKAESEGYLRQMVEKLSSNGQRQAPPAEDEDPLKGMDAAKFVDILTEKGPQGLRQAGFLTKADLKEAMAAVKEEMRGAVREEVDSTVKSLGKNANLAQKHPELNDPDSALSVRVKEIYKELTDDEPEAAGRRATWVAAVRAATAEMKTAEPAKPKTQDRVDFLRRVSPERGTGHHGELQVDEINESTSRMLAGLGVKPEAYLKQRRAGGGR